MNDNGFWKVCAALDNPTRLRLLKLLIETTEYPCVVDIAEELDISVPVASLYLKQLREAGLVSCKRDDRRVYYRAFATTSEGERIIDEFRRFFACEPNEQRIFDLLEVTRALGHFRRNVFLRFLAERSDADIKTAAADLSIPPTTLDRLFNQLGHARLVDACGRVSRPARMPEDLLFELTLK